MTKLLNHLKHNVVAYLALFVALGGTSYAAVNLPAGSVGTKQLRNGVVTNKKLANGSVGKLPRALGPQLDRIAGLRPRVRADQRAGPDHSLAPAAKVLGVGSAGSVPQVTIQWSRPIPATCFAEATTNTQVGDVSYASASLAAEEPERDALTYISLSAAGHPVNVAIICPQP